MGKNGEGETDGGGELLEELLVGGEGDEGWGGDARGTLRAPRGYIPRLHVGKRTFRHIHAGNSCSSSRRCLLLLHFGPLSNTANIQPQSVRYPMTNFPVQLSVCLSLFFGLFTSYGLRVCISVAAAPNAAHPLPPPTTPPPMPPGASLGDPEGGARPGVSMYDEFGWDGTTKGLVLSSFFWGYLPMQVCHACQAHSTLVVALCSSCPSRCYLICMKNRYERVHGDCCCMTQFLTRADSCWAALKAYRGQGCSCILNGACLRLHPPHTP